MSDKRHDVHQLAITALSPLHIGTGQDLEPTSYVIDGEDLYLFSPEAALHALSEPAREELLAILGAAPRVQLIKQVQSFFHRNGEALIAEAEHAMPVLPSIAADYRQRVGKTAQREESGREIINQLAIARTYGDAASGRPILPGSSLKGAIRTALLFKDGREIAAQAENLRQVLECVPPLRPQAFRGQLGVQDVTGLSSRKLPDPQLRWSAADIGAACNRFYQPILERELRELRTRGYLSAAWVDTIKQVLADQQAAFDAGQAFLLRVGRHSGAESVTLNGVRRIKILGARGERPQYLEAAKTVWLAAGDIQQRTELLPFGWVLVEAAPVGRTLPVWPSSLRDTLAAQTGAETEAWYRRISERQTTLRTAAAERRAFEQQRAQEAARAQQEEQARAERLANLSPEQRTIEELRQRLAEDRAVGRKEKGGELANQLVTVLKQAEQAWSGPDCAELADLAEEIHGYIGWPASKKKQARKDQIAAIRAKA